MYGKKGKTKDLLAALGPKSGKRKAKKEESDDDPEFKGLDGREIIQRKAISKRHDFDKMVADAEMIMKELKNVEEKLI